MVIDNNQLKDILISNGFVTKENFDEAVIEANRLDKEITDILVEQGYIPTEQLGLLIADAIGYQYINLHDHEINEKALQTIPEVVARSKKLVIFDENDEGVQVGMVDPTDLESIHMISKRTGKKVFPFYITRSDLASVLPRYKTSLIEEFNLLIEKLKDTEATTEEKDRVTIEVVDLLLQFGYRSEASDVHIEPFEDDVNVRFRIDGIMHDVLRIPKKLYNSILTRIKIMARLRTDEHQAPQDGRLRFTFDEDEIDVRVSIVPVTKGENVVMRLLSSAIRMYSLNNIGLAESDYQKVVEYADNPQGMILVVGPTGSGKTTTVYAVMKILNSRKVHVATIEDPVEYDVAGISQIQVNPTVGLTFADGLRSIVRQDPDVIMVGEIRDRETADIAVNAAMTGHVVLSTIHANDAATTIIRMMDMGVEEYLVASTVSIVIAQRLVRKICASCRVSHILTPQEKKYISDNALLNRLFEEQGQGTKTRVYKGKGGSCEVCGGSGYHGRIGIFEILLMSDKQRDLIMKRVSHKEIHAQAQVDGMTTMLEDGVRKVLLGVTTLDEVLRVIHE